MGGSSEKDCGTVAQSLSIREMSVRASHLLIKNVNSRNPVSRRTNESTKEKSEEDARTELEGLMKELTAQNFAEYAKKYSDCGSYAKGGDLGVFKEGEMMQPFYEG